jgi:hypothetical protein
MQQQELQIKHQEVKIKEQEMQIKQQKMATDGAAKQDQLELEEKKIESQERIAGLQVGAKKSADEANLAFKREEAGLRRGMEINKQTDMPAEEEDEEVNSFEEGGSVYDESEEDYPVEEEMSADYGDREDGTPKGAGYQGEIQMDDGSVATEMSINVNLDGEDILIPSIVPASTPEEIDFIKQGGDVRKSRAIVQKAIAFAKEQKGKGLPYFK